MAVERLFDGVSHVTTWFDLFTEPGHGFVGLLQAQGFGPGNAQALLPASGMAIRAGHHQPVQHGQVDDPLDIEAEVSIDQQAAQHVAAAGLLPQPPEHQVGADTAPPQFGQFAAL
ncbi:MAG: hypothetical protein ACJ8AI_06915, partial [Rhodopila sp.]